MELDQLPGLGGVLAQKMEWIGIGIATSAASVTLGYYQKPWFSVGEYGVTGVDIAWSLVTIISVMSIVKIGFAIYEHVLNCRHINIQIEREEWNGKDRRK